MCTQSNYLIDNVPSSVWIEKIGNQNGNFCYKEYNTYKWQLTPYMQSNNFMHLFKVVLMQVKQDCRNERPENITVKFPSCTRNI